MCAGYFCPTARSGLDCSERSERRPVTIPALARRTTVPTHGCLPWSSFRPCPKRSRNVCPYVRVLCVCVPPVCGPGPGLRRPPARRTAPRFPNRARARIRHPLRNCDRFLRSRFRGLFLSSGVSRGLLACCIPLRAPCATTNVTHYYSSSHSFERCSGGATRNRVSVLYAVADRPVPAVCALSMCTVQTETDRALNGNG